MKANRTEIQGYVLATIEELSHDWDYASAVTPDSLLFTELGLESLDVVVLGTAIQEHYRFQMPFAEFLAEIGQREHRDLSIAELVDFVDKHLNADLREVASATRLDQ
jgi:acyl carrier protein